MSETMTETSPKFKIGDKINWNGKVLVIKSIDYNSEFYEFEPSGMLSWSAIDKGINGNSFQNEAATLVVGGFNRRSRKGKKSKKVKSRKNHRKSNRRRRY